MNRNDSIPFCYIIAALYVVVAFAESMMGFDKVTAKLILDPIMVKEHGQIWRVITYPFLNDSGMIMLIFKVLVSVYICAPLEHFWGKRFFGIVFFSSVLGGAAAALIFDLVLSDSTFVSLTMMLIHGQMFPQSRLFLMFIFPVTVRVLSYIGTVLVILSIFSRQRSPWEAVAIVMGVFTGVLVWYFTKQWKIKKKLPNIANNLNNAVAKSKPNSKVNLEAKAKKIVQGYESSQVIDPVDESWLEDLDKDVKFDRNDVCSPHSFNPQGNICSSCDGFNICLKRRSKMEIEALSEPGEDENSPSSSQ